MGVVVVVVVVFGDGVCFDNAGCVIVSVGQVGACALHAHFVCCRFELCAARVIAVSYTHLTLPTIYSV